MQSGDNGNNAYISVSSNLSEKRWGWRSGRVLSLSSALLLSFWHVKDWLGS